MEHYKNNEGAVFAYLKSDLAQISRINELELLIQEKEPIYVEAGHNLQIATQELNNANIALEEAQKAIILDDENQLTENKEEIQSCILLVNIKAGQHDEALVIFNHIESEYQCLTIEHDSILPIFFEIRKNLKSMKKMSSKEVDAFLNSPVPKEQIIAEAEQQKKSLLNEASEAIAPFQYAVDLSMATDEETVHLKAWQKYSVLLNRVDTSTAPDIEWPVKP